MRSVLKILVMCAAACGMAFAGHAQVVSTAADTVKKNPSIAARPVKPKGPKPIKREVSVGLRLNTDGWSVYSDIGHAKFKNAKQSDMFYDVRLWQVELSEKKSPKQEKTTVDGNASGSSSSYVYGKVNNFYALKLGYGIRKMIAGKPEPGTVSIHWMNMIGVSLGMVKPYYINVESDPNAIKYTDDTRSNFLSQRLIVGSAGFSKGLSEMTFVPGGHIKSALHFDFSTNRKNVLGVETGFNFEYYGSPISIMANEEARPYFFDIFLAFQFGRRW